MKKLIYSLALVSAFGLSSCVVSHTAMVTGAPVGTKVGVAKATSFSPNADISIKKAAENGNIKKVASVETKVSVFIITFAKTIVTGE